MRLPISNFAARPSTVWLGPRSLCSALNSRTGLLTLAISAVLLVVGARAGGPADLAREIDTLVDQHLAEMGATPAARTSDAEFLRRIRLDLTGRIPTLAEVEAFLASEEPQKRIALVEKLLTSPEHARQMQRMLDVWLMRRRPNKHVPQPQWEQYLFDAARANRPWDELTRELLRADGAESAPRPAARFLLDRELKTEETVRDIGRVFLGRDLQCAQCHDHPSFGDYLQRHYHGIAAFLNRAYLFKDPATKLTVIGEKAEGEVKFTSVFTSEQGMVAPRILDLPELFDPPVEDPQGLYVQKPDKKTRGEPTHSRRAMLASAVTDPRNDAFRMNIANRLWAAMMGRGLIEPLDMIHEDSENLHPQLLQRLADDLHQHGYDMRRTLHAITLTDAYQRRSTAAETDPLAAAVMKPLTPEQLAVAALIATGVERRYVEAAKAKLPPQPAWDPDTLQPPLEMSPTAAEQQRRWRLEAEVTKATAGEVAAFAKVFISGNETGAFDATASQALFFRNGAKLTAWLTPRQGSLCERLLAHEQDLSVAVREAYLSIYSRPPTKSEASLAVDFIQGFESDRLAGLQALVRAMLCSAEFRLNH